jgi:hypothetical protein
MLLEGRARFVPDSRDRSIQRLSRPRPTIVIEIPGIAQTLTYPTARSNAVDRLFVAILEHFSQKPSHLVDRHLLSLHHLLLNFFVL